MVDINIRYAYGNPTSSSPLTPPDGKRIFIGLFGTQKSTCMIMNGKIYCFVNNNYASEAQHLQQVFPSSTCHSGTSNGVNYLQCGSTETDNLTCHYYTNGDLYCYDFLTEEAVRFIQMVPLLVNSIIKEANASFCV